MRFRRVSAGFLPSPALFRPPPAHWHPPQSHRTCRGRTHLECTGREKQQQHAAQKSAVAHGRGPPIAWALKEAGNKKKEGDIFAGTPSESWSVRVRWGNGVMALRTAFERMDANGDGVVSFAEFAAAHVQEEEEPGCAAGHVFESSVDQRNTHSAEHDSHQGVRLRWQPGPCIGKGAFAEVFQGIDTETGKFLAVKQIKLKNEALAAAKALQREINVMMQLPRHRNIVKYLGCEQTSDRFFIFLEFCSGGSIASMLEKFGALDESIVKRYTREVLSGLEFLHSSGIVHCDIKGGNLLVSEDGVVKLADFNSSRLLESMTAGGAQDSRSLVGTPSFMAPEVAKQLDAGFKADIWSVGCTIIQMLKANSDIWNGATNAQALIFRICCATCPPMFPEGASTDCLDFLSRCFQIEPEDRPTSQELLRHSFVALHGGAPKGALVPADPERGGERERERETIVAAEVICDRPGRPEVRVAIEEDCDLSLQCSNSVCCTVGGVGFPKLWSGARANVGLCGPTGKFLFEVEVLRELAVSQQEAGAASPDTVCMCRVGWSTLASPVDRLGEDALSWAYGGTGKRAHSGHFDPFGEPYGAGDLISCGLDLGTGVLSFAKNGRIFPAAYTLDLQTIAGGIFPHILLKNVEVRVDFSRRGLAGSSCLPGYHPIQEAVSLQACTRPQPLPERPELIMLVGLPGSGKTTWARNHMLLHPHKRYTLLSTDEIMDRMKVSGLPRQANYAERWEKLMPEASQVLDTLVKIAATRRRNFIWDQTNVYCSARQRKLAPFKSFSKHAKVFVLEAWQLALRARARERKEGKIVPEEAVQKMRERFVIPESNTREGFDDVAFIGIKGQEAVEIVARENREAAQWLAAQQEAARERDRGRETGIRKRKAWDEGGRGGDRGSGWGGREAGRAPLEYVEGSRGREGYGEGARGMGQVYYDYCQTTGAERVVRREGEAWRPSRGDREAWEWGIGRGGGREREERESARGREREEREKEGRGWNGVSAQGWEEGGRRWGWRGRDDRGGVRDEGILPQPAAMGREHAGPRDWAGERCAGSSEDRSAEGSRRGVSHHQPHIQPPHPDARRSHIRRMSPDARRGSHAGYANGV